MVQQFGARAGARRQIHHRPRGQLLHSVRGCRQNGQRCQRSAHPLCLRNAGKPESDYRRRAGSERDGGRHGKGRRLLGGQQERQRFREDYGGAGQRKL